MYREILQRTDKAPSPVLSLKSSRPPYSDQEKSLLFYHYYMHWRPPCPPSVLISNLSNQHLTEHTTSPFGTRRRSARLYLLALDTLRVALINAPVNHWTLACREKLKYVTSH